MIDFEEKMKTTKSTLIDKDYVNIRKDTFDSMNKVINETKKAIEFQPKIDELFNDVQTFTKSHQTLEKENNSIKSYLKAILEALKNFFREMLQIGNEKIKETTTNEIKDYYDNEDFNSNDVYDIAKGTTKKDELFDYAKVPSYLKTSKKSYEKDKDDFEIGM